MDRAEHLQWCKDRAMEYANSGDLVNAVASMLSDMNKHPETKLKGATEMLAMLAIQQAASDDADGVKRFITGFN
jgi:hypothetical protein